MRCGAEGADMAQSYPSCHSSRRRARAGVDLARARGIPRHGWGSSLRRYLRRIAASGERATLPPMRPSDLQLDIDAYAGPFDLLCTLLLRRELTLADVRVVEVVV